MELTEASLIERMRLIRKLFHLAGMDIRHYRDAPIADAFLSVCPIVDTAWPSDDQMLAVYRKLRVGATPPVSD